MSEVKSQGYRVSIAFRPPLEFQQLVALALPLSGDLPDCVSYSIRARGVVYIFTGEQAERELSDLIQEKLRDHSRIIALVVVNPLTPEKR